MQTFIAAVIGALVLACLGQGLAHAAPDPGPFDPAARARALDSIAGLIENRYVYKDKASAIAAEVRGLKSDPELAGAADRQVWAAIVTRHLDTHDLHFDVTWSPPSAGPQPIRAPGPQDPAAIDRSLAGVNYGFNDVQRLPGNIGYIRMSMFAPFDTALTGEAAMGARKAGEAALQLVAGTDAVIFDLRQNGGGSPEMIDLLLAGFFGDKPVLLNRFYQRDSDQKADFTTLANYAGPRRPSVPVYVLVSAHTGSAAEEFAYDVQTQKRGVLVGETTAGAANPGDDFDAGDGFTVFVSTGAAVNPITGTNWEGVGVKPDIEVPAADALNRAEALALSGLIKANTSTAPVEAAWALQRLNAGPAGAPLSPQDAAAFVGDFGGRSVTWDGASLTYRRGHAVLSLIPLGGDTFAVADASDLHMSFERGPDGKAAVLVVSTTLGDVVRFARSAVTP